MNPAFDELCAAPFWEAFPSFSCFLCCVESLMHSYVSWLLLFPELWHSIQRLVLWSGAWSASPVFFSSSLKASALTLKPWIHFELTFGQGERQGPIFSSLHMDIQFPQHCLLKRLYPMHVLVPLLRIRWLWLCGPCISLTLCQYCAVFITVLASLFKRRMTSGKEITAGTLLNFL